MKFAPVIPVKWARLLDLESPLMVQSFNVKPDDFEWLGSRQEIILDNGVYEQGAPNTDYLLEVIRAVRPYEVVCPDMIKNPQSTIELLQKYMPILMGLMDGGLLDSIMIVPQGQSLPDWIRCEEIMYTTCMAEWNYDPIIGIPKYLEGYTTRLHLVSYLTNYLGRCCGQLHLLGTQQSFDELVWAAKMFPHIRSADSTWPTAYALAGQFIPMRGGFKYDIKPEHWQLTSPSSDILVRTAVNVATCRSLIYGSKMSRLPF